jgi:hypothetical protein
LHKHFEYECTFKDLKKRFFILVINILYLLITIKTLVKAFQPLKPISYIMIDLMTLCIGPKRCDMEIKNFKSEKTIGRLLFDVHVRQLQLMHISLQDLMIKFNKKEEKPHFAQFKVLTTDNNPMTSEKTQTVMGKYKKERNMTTFKWKNCDSLYDDATVEVEVSLESLKASTIQICLLVDREYA